ncbi:hypothetical protein F7R91_11295 [Streptomyces luteolifulvus]|jgi:hypothetical protein|uniref:Methylamine utilisation protein MauE domain-containing protein n=1 Tax=Streptomyces luteolifulvus TaxID=2615112 RepID=A0A6H9V4W4_9ACTN|nr:MauE/DoxX family redox-associated membrane protein [Streptomyces luteolifulvus]KAB1147669.1 hypothetical protein F7R91_11295 [Streptomyces luteolifulvus]
MKAVEAFGQLCLTAVFLWSGLSKIRDIHEFRRHLAVTIPGLLRFSGVLAAAVPAAELCIASLILLCPLRWIGFAAAMLLLFAFTAYLLSLIWSRSEASCGCVGASGTPTSGAHVVRNVFLLATCATTWWATAHSASPGLSHYAIIAAPATVVGITLLYLGELSSLFRTTHVK